MAITDRRRIVVALVCIFIAMLALARVYPIAAPVLYGIAGIAVVTALIIAIMSADPNQRGKLIAISILAFLAGNIVFYFLIRGLS